MKTTRNHHKLSELPVDKMEKQGDSLILYGLNGVIYSQLPIRIYLDNLNSTNTFKPIRSANHLPYDNIKLPEHLKPCFLQPCKLTIFPNGNTTLTNSSQGEGVRRYCVSTNGTRIITANMEIDYLDINELNPEMIEYVDSNSNSKQPYEFQLNLHKDNISNLRKWVHETFPKETHNIELMAKPINTFQIEFYQTYPLPPNDQVFFDHVTKTVSRIFHEPSEREKNDHKKGYYYALWYIPVENNKNQRKRRNEYVK